MPCATNTDDGATVVKWIQDHGSNIRWSTWLLTLALPAFGVFVAEQLVETITVFGSHGFIAPGGPMNLLLGAGLFFVASIATAVALAQLGSGTFGFAVRPRATRPST